MVITSKQNPAVKKIIGLRNRRDRQQAGMTLVDGFEELMCAIKSGVKVDHLYYCPELMGSGQERKAVELITGGMAATEFSRQVFEKVAYREGADGWLAVVPEPKMRLQDLDLPKKPLLLVCEAVEKPGNLGAMLRTADAAGVDAVISVNGVTDWGNPNVIRASKGAVFTVPAVDTTYEDFMKWLREKKIQLIASTPDTSTLYTEPDLTLGVALTVGSEKYGHSQKWLDTADKKVLIPMVGKINSLNVATSAALLVYEAVRQRATS